MQQSRPAVADPDFDPNTLDGEIREWNDRVNDTIRATLPGVPNWFEVESTTEIDSLGRNLGEYSIALAAVLRATGNPEAILACKEIAHYAIELLRPSWAECVGDNRANRKLSQGFIFGALTQLTYLLHANEDFDDETRSLSQRCKHLLRELERFKCKTPDECPPMGGGAWRRWWALGKWKRFAHSVCYQMRSAYQFHIMFPECRFEPPQESDSYYSFTHAYLMNRFLRQAHIIPDDAYTPWYRVGWDRDIHDDAAKRSYSRACVSDSAGFGRICQVVALKTTYVNYVVSTMLDLYFENALTGNTESDEQFLKMLAGTVAYLRKAKEDNRKNYYPKRMYGPPHDKRDRSNPDNCRSSLIRFEHNQAVESFVGLARWGNGEMRPFFDGMTSRYESVAESREGLHIAAWYLLSLVADSDNSSGCRP